MKYEYTIYIQIRNGTPFCSGIYSNEKQVEEHLKSLIRRHKQYKQIYYVDNKNYDNEYSKAQTGTYYKILRRPINDWQELTEKCNIFVK